MEQRPDAHDRFFRFAISRVDCARNLIASQLSDQALAILDLETLQPAPDSFVDSSLRKRFSDVAFLVKLRDGTTSSEALVCILFEHKSFEEPLTALQLLGYIVRIWEKRLRDSLPLLPIIPLVVYHGSNPWSAPRSIAELILCPAALQHYHVGFQFPLLDLRSTRDFLLTEAGNPAIDSVL